MMTGDGQAIGSYRGMAYTGALAWKLKNKIDRYVQVPVRVARVVSARVVCC